MRENQQDEGVGRVLNILNHLFLLERKIDKLENPSSLQRHIDRIYGEFTEIGFISENPIGQPYNETRTDCDASIAGESAENLVIVEVIKPLVRSRVEGSTRILQRAVVVVESAGSISVDDYEEKDASCSDTAADRERSPFLERAIASIVASISFFRTKLEKIIKRSHE